MRYLIVLTFCLITLNGWAQGNCSAYASTNTKPVKITFFTSTPECFVVSNESGAINPEPAKSVVFFVDPGVMKTKTKLSNGTLLEKTVMTNADMASAVFEIVYNEKKGVYDIKSRLGQVELTAEASQKNQEEMARMTNERKEADAARDKEWADAAAARKEKAEAENAAEKKQEDEKKAQADKAAADKAQQSVPVTTPVASNPQPAPNTPATITSGANATVGGPASVDKTAGFRYDFVFSYDQRRINHVRFIYRTDDAKKEIIMSGVSDDQGQVTMYSDYPLGTYDAELMLEVNGVAGKPMSKKLTLRGANDIGTVLDFGSYVDGYMKAAQMTRSEVEKMIGLDRAFGR